MGRIVIIEDEPDVVELYRIVLEEEGHDLVGVFSDPQAALAEAASLDPEIVVLDERLRGRSGLASLPDLQAAWPEARVLVATADPDAVVAARRSGAAEVMEKPFPLDDLLEVISRLL